MALWPVGVRVGVFYRQVLLTSPQREHFVFSIVRGVYQGLEIFDSRWFMVVANDFQSRTGPK
ncbi:unnamed protein product [Ixodes pacificus]